MRIRGPSADAGSRPLQDSEDGKGRRRGRGFDYIYDDVAERRLYVPRGGARETPATDATPTVAAVPGRVTVLDLDSLAPVGKIPDTGWNGVAVDSTSGHGFSSSGSVSMFDTRTLKVIKKIDVGTARPDGILFDAFNDRIHVFSHPTKNAVVIDSKDARWWAAMGAVRRPANG